jgi:predicted benzoate:H+ symporter BenE
MSTFCGPWMTAFGVCSSTRTCCQHSGLKPFPLLHIWSTDDRVVLVATLPHTSFSLVCLLAMIISRCLVVFASQIK